MTIEMIENEIAAFGDKFFDDYFELVDINLDFIEEHELYEPKKNYFITYDFLMTTIRHFTNLDVRFMHGTFQKLNRDVQILHKQYEKIVANEERVEEIFKNSFLRKSPLFKEIYDELISLQKGVTLDEYERETKEILKDHYSALEEIYKEYFVEDFLTLNKEFLVSIRKILNTKLYYLDRLLWIHANRSEVILHSLKTLKIENDIDSKKYIAYRLSVSLPYTENYKYLQKCIRTYR